MNMKLKIVDEQNRDLLICNENAEVAIARYPNMEKETKEYIASVYVDITGTYMEDVMSFLNFEEDNEFCA